MNNIFEEIKRDLRSIIYESIPSLNTRLAVVETIEAIWDEKRRPQIQSGKNNIFIINLPPGISFKDFYSKIDYFKDAAGGDQVNVSISQRGKQAVLQIFPDRLLPYYKYDSNYPHSGILPIQLGYSNRKLEVIDLTVLPHMLIGGSTGGGKSNFIHATVNSLLGLKTPPKIMMIDLKMSEYAYLENDILLITDLEEACEALNRLVGEMRKRQLMLKSSRCVDIKKYNKKCGGMDYIVLIIDELAELKEKDAQEDLETLLRLCRASGICIIAATQRPSSSMFAKKSFGDSKANFSGRLCFQVNSDIDQKIILDEYGTTKIPAISGRAIWRHGTEFIEIQTPYFDTEGVMGVEREHASVRITARQPAEKSTK